MSRTSISLKDYNPLSLSPGGALPSRSSLTPRRLFAPLLAISALALLAVFSLSSGSGGLSRYIPGRTGQRTTVALLEQDEWDGVGKPLRMGASVEERLRSWEMAPLGENADWVRQNLKVSFGGFPPCQWWIEMGRSGARGT